ncbi:TRAFs-binding domain-containing protein [Magnetococcus sp. PR-3]|uniref:TRAFs-binding domain-containing protein n=1 Tax=Magnetococcus sp. PR-3 TaxID=3120355 RepID=UPI002FCE2509
MSNKPLCFVLMPFGRKESADGRSIDFDGVYQQLIKPAIEDAGLEPLRADEEIDGGFIHKAMFERLIFCDYAVADLTTANANVFYELGVRHAIRPFSTVLMHADGFRLPFDVSPLRSFPYGLSRNGCPDNSDKDLLGLRKRLTECRECTTDSPVYQLVRDIPPPDIKRLKTDEFREHMAYSARLKRELARARAQGAGALHGIEEQLGPIKDVEAGVVVDLFLSYRATESWGNMISLAERMSKPLSGMVMIREQLGFALNRAGRREEAEEVLNAVIKANGPSSETLGLLGRIYKDRWETAMEAGQDALAKGWLLKAVDAYLQGFESDWRDAYPGINALTLMEISDPPDPRRLELQPIVEYAVRRRLSDRDADYWDYATLLEIAVLKKDEAMAREALSSALVNVRESWEPKTTLRNLNLIQHARGQRGERADWYNEIEAELLNAGENYSHG